MIGKHSIADVIDILIDISESAGRLIMDVYERDSGFEVAEKKDSSPVTEADVRASEHIISLLNQHFPELPVISEEGTLPAFDERKHWSRYWLVDPLDGTKEFVHRNGDFTVNIALIDQGIAAFGVVHAPVHSATYVGCLSHLNNGDKDKYAVAQKCANGLRRDIEVRKSKNNVETGKALIALASRSHLGQATVDYLDKVEKALAPVHREAVGSSLKFCQIAEGLADFYPRIGPTSEWDTAAGQAVLEAAGGKVIVRGGSPLRYNQKESFLNPDFFALADDEIDWPKL